MEAKGINVLSLFDGMSCGQIALDRLGVKVNKYFACEIDKYAMQVTQHNFPDTIQLGDVQFVTKETFGTHKIDLVIGGSPCQGFSFAGKMLNFDDPRSKLFFEYVRLVRDLKPKYFLLENVKMKQESKDIITEYMGVEPIEINSALVSAQTRKRLYWTNIPNVTQPEDRGIVLRDILDYSVNDELSEKENAYMESGNSKWNGAENRRFDLYGQKEDSKAGCLTANMYKGVPYRVVGIEQHGNKLRHPEATKKGYAEAGEGEGLDLTFPDSKTRRGRAMKDKSNCLTAASHDMGVVVKGGVVRGRYNEDGKTEQRLEVRKDDKTNSITTVQKDSVVVDKKLVWRKLTPLECERLQTVPDGYTLVLDENGKQLVSDSQRYKMLGNGWTVDVIVHIMKNMKFD